MKRKIYKAAQMAQLYQENPGVWLLLEVRARNPNGRATRLKLLKQAKNKDDLYDFLMEQENWDLSKDYVFVFSDPGKQCEII
ncbi:MAG: hypothetical protein IPM81_05355 [Saprospirales bacterium]|nr:hypothetical protein [Saprospirales bacterium]